MVLEAGTSTCSHSKNNICCKNNLKPTLCSKFNFLRNLRNSYMSEKLAYLWFKIRQKYPGFNILSFYFCYLSGLPSMLTNRELDCPDRLT